MTTLKLKIAGLVVLILATFLNAVPTEKLAGTTMAPDDVGNSTLLSDQDLDEPETSKNQAMAKDLEEVKLKNCELLLGECWLLYERTKPYLEEELRETICLKRIRGFGSCLHLTEDEMSKVKEDVEKRQKLEKEQAAEKEKKDAERKKQLDKLRADWTQIRMMGCGESLENSSSTTAEPGVLDGLDDEVVTEGQFMRSLSTDSIEIDF